MHREYLHEGTLPFCLGCGHTTISENIDKALQTTGIPLLDVILVTDIGCHGIIDKSFKTHTVHGLHGRSIALASGISLSLTHPGKKVIVFIGDGGATIGLQHLIDAAHKNINLTVVLHNNMLYGMTGGQPSELTPLGFKTPTLPEGNKIKGFDICNVVAAAGASYVSRVVGIGDISSQLAEALSKKGFSLVEVMEICPSYAVKSNPGMKLRQVTEEAGLSIKVYADRDTEGFRPDIRTETPSLLDNMPVIPIHYRSERSSVARIMIAGSAGEGVQSAAELFARAAIASGLNVTKKGSYPVTVGIGFSASDIILSPEPIEYTGSHIPDYVVITSQEGLDYSKALIRRMDHGTVFIDESLPETETRAHTVRVDFRKKAGARNAAIYSLLYLAQSEKLFPVNAMLDFLKEGKMSGKADWGKMVGE
ncbi:MAG: 2-oxoacid:acceptor oxidoreductase family protein [Bacteroidetes bacterium]|nr:2-oxoacid:acceptor oxidoreductase family protein [Bacteroidota bacterium]